MRTGSLCAAVVITAAGATIAAPQAHATTLVDTADGSPFSSRTAAQADEVNMTALAQGFTLTEDAVLNGATLRGYSAGANITLAITDAMGAGASGSNILFEQNFAVNADAFGSSMHSFDLGSLNLTAGDYFLVVTSNDDTGFEWARTSRAGSLNTNDRGSSTFAVGAPYVSQNYTFETNESDQIFIMEIDGGAVPAPGAAAVAALGGLVASRRRRS